VYVGRSRRFEAYKRLFSYDKTDLAATVDAVDESEPSWRRERVSFVAAYGGERMVAYVYLPRGGKPPYQTVFVMPGAGAWDERSSETVAASPFFGYLVRSGRAAVLPLYKGTYERGSDAFKQDVSKASSLWRDHTIAFAKDLARTVDYAETRPELDKDRLAFLGLSRGGALSPVMLANEKRIKNALLLASASWGNKGPATELGFQEIGSCPFIRHGQGLKLLLSMHRRNPIVPSRSGCAGAAGRPAVIT
jgi:dienelactone hydrolase